MEFSALNVDFSSPSPDPVGSRRPAHAGVKVGYLSKKWLFIELACLSWIWLQICTDMLQIITSTGDELLKNVNIDNHEWPWTLKIGVLVIFGCKRVNCDEMDGVRPRLPANRNCYRLSCVSWVLAQISCQLKKGCFLIKFCSVWS